MKICALHVMKLVKNVQVLKNLNVLAVLYHYIWKEINVCSYVKMENFMKKKQNHVKVVSVLVKHAKILHPNA